MSLFFSVGKCHAKCSSLGPVCNKEGLGTRLDSKLPLQGKGETLMSQDANGKTLKAAAKYLLGFQGRLNVVTCISQDSGYTGSSMWNTPSGGEVHSRGCEVNLQEETYMMSFKFESAC